MRKDRLALGGSQFLQNVGQFRWVNAGQPLMLDAQLDPPRRIGLNYVDKLPGNCARAEPARNRFEPRSWQHAFEDPAKRAAQPNFDFGHAQMMGRPMIGPLQVHIVDADYFSAVDVDDLAVNEVTLEEKIAAFVLEG